jgi:F-type H+-transporting ATPase subunit delta
MRAASRETYGVAKDKLDDIARNADPAALAALGDDLLAVAELLVKEPRLRRALADPARSGKDRAALLDALIASKLGKDARELSTLLAGGRWSSMTDLLDGFEQLGVRALLASAERAGDLSEVEDELFRLGQVIDGTPELAAALGDTSTPVDRRATIIDALLDGKAKPATIRLAKLALAGFGGRTFAGGLTRLVELAADLRNEQVVYVTVASPLAEADERRLGDRLAQMYGREVSIQVTVDPSVLGGARVRIGSDLYDGTTLRRLIDVRHALTGN